MRLKKNMKRTAAAALALSMAVSTAAVPASAGFNIDMSKVKGDVTITKDESGVTVSVGDKTYTKNDVSAEDGITYDDEDESDATLTGDNTKNPNRAASAAATQEQNGETTPAENADAEAEGEEPAAPATMDLTEADYAPAGDADTEEPADSQTEEPGRTVEETEDGTVITYDDYDVDPDTQVTKAPEKAPEAEKTAEEPEKDDSGTVTYESKETANSVTRAVQSAAKSAARYVVSIINKVTGKDNALNVTLDNVTVKAKNGKNAVTVNQDSKGKTYEGDVTLSLKGESTLRGGDAVETKGNDKTGKDGIYFASQTNDTTLTVQNKEQNVNGTLNVTGGNADDNNVEPTNTEADVNVQGGAGIRAASGARPDFSSGTLVMVATGPQISMKSGIVHAKGGDAVTYRWNQFVYDKHRAYGGSGMKGNFTFSDAYVETRGGNALSKDIAYGGTGLTTNSKIKISGGVVDAVGGNAEVTGIDASWREENDFTTGGDGVLGDSLELNDGAELIAVGGNAKGKERNITGGKGFRSTLNLNISAKNGSSLITRGGDAELVKTDTKKPTQCLPGAGLQFTGMTRTSITVEGNSKITAVGGNNIGDTEHPDGGAGISIKGSIKIKTTDASHITVENGLSSDGTRSEATDSKIQENQVTVVKADHTHHWDANGEKDPLGGTIYHCTDPGCHAEKYDPPIHKDDNDDDNNNNNGGSTGESDTNTALELRVTDADGLNVPFSVAQDGTVRTYTVSADTATLTGNMAALKYLQEHGTETVVFVTNQHTSTFNINDVLAQGGGSANLYLTHTGTEAQLLVVG